jgi:hypothetical protein
MFALMVITRNRLARRDVTFGKVTLAQSSFLLSVLLPSILSAILLAEMLGSDPLGKLFDKLGGQCNPLAPVIIERIEENSPAATAGLKKDDIILKIAESNLDSIDDLSGGIAKPSTADIPITFTRSGQELSTSLKAELKFPKDDKDTSPLLVLRPLGIWLTQGWLQPRRGAWWFGAAGALAGGLVYLISYVAAWITIRTRFGLTDFFAWSISGCVYGALVAFAFYLDLRLPGAGGPELATMMFLDSPALPLTVGVPWILGSQLLAQFIFVGLSSFDSASDLDREWMGRCGGWILIAALTFFLISFLVFGALILLLQSSYIDAVREFVKVTVVPISGLSGIATAFLGKSGLTELAPNAAKQRWVKRVANIVLLIAAPLFVAGLIFMLSLTIDKLFIGTLLFEDFSISAGEPEDKVRQGFSAVWTEYLGPLLLATTVFGVSALLASWFVNINRFSLHAFYRNRLIRAFLGASRTRRPDLFTGFDDEDNPKLARLWPRKDAGIWQPFHVINMTLNLVSTKQYSWQERKAAPFTATPLHCGTGSLIETCERRGRNLRARNAPGAVVLFSNSVAVRKAMAVMRRAVRKITLRLPLQLRAKRRAYWIAQSQQAVVTVSRGAYRAAADYGGGISLGTAMAISGAAVSPNMGYHTSPTITFLMTMLNVRLGWWLGNPAYERKAAYKDDGPVWAIVPILEELLGATTEGRKYVYLSDGGHFENLGLYEMVRRRCRFILVVDAGCDRTFSFEELGNAVRKISVDLGVPVQFFGMENLRARSEEASSSHSTQAYHAVGVIDYRVIDGAVSNGIIIYIKPCYYGTEGSGIRGYAISHPDFPHQSTLDQWFTESQFESYRSLGFAIMDDILKQAYHATVGCEDFGLEAVFTALLNKAISKQGIELQTNEITGRAGDRRSEGGMDVTLPP